MANILLVDDDESIRDSVKSLLRSVGYQVAIFESAEQFLESGMLRGTGCLILDIRMPGMGGLELQRRLNTLQSWVPIVFLTGLHDKTDRQRAIEGGASDFLQKPVAANVLLGAVDVALKSWRL